MLHIENFGDFLLDTAILPAEKSIIKVIGVGGGGSNAVNYMYMQGIEDVSFMVCNTDNQALERSPVPHKLQLGPNTTKGLGAGGSPEIGRAAALESLPDIETALGDGTKMVFITAGMGGGTGTGAAPIIANAAKRSGILTVGIVTIPFMFEGKKRITQALAGAKEMSECVDAVLVIHNEKLKAIYPDFKIRNALAKADDVLAKAARGIAEIITRHGYINVDFADIRTIMKDSDVAVMNTGYAEGDNRIYNAINDALESPLLEDSDIDEAKKVVLYVYHSEESEITMEEMDEFKRFMEQMDRNIEVIWGLCIDDTLGESVKVTLVATGFSLKTLPGMDTLESGGKKEVIRLDDITGKGDAAPEKAATQSDSDPYEYYAAAILNKPKIQQSNSLSLADLDDDDRIGHLSRESAYRRRHGDGVAAVAQPVTDLSKRFVLDENSEIKEKNNILFNNPD